MDDQTTQSDAQDPEPQRRSRSGVFPTLPDIEIRRLIGKGGVGAVYEGYQPLLDRRVAVKVLHVDRGIDDGETTDRRFRREARLLANLTHPNIVGCYYAGLTGDGAFYLLMELVEGPDLANYITKNGPLDVQTALNVARAIASALGHASEQGLIHRDVKPANILLQRRSAADDKDVFPFVPKLADLGLARYQFGDGHTADLATLTAEGAIMGTPATMAPEQYADPNSVDFRADIYALGCVLFAMLAGKLPYSGLKLTEIVTSKISQPPPDLTKDRPEVPRATANLVAKMMAKKPEERPESYTELKGELDALLVNPRRTAEMARAAPAEQEEAPREKKAAGLSPTAMTMIVVVVGAVLVVGGFGAKSFLGEQAQGGETQAGTEEQAAAQPNAEPTAAPSPAITEVRAVEEWGAPRDLIAEGFTDRMNGWVREGGTWGPSEEGSGIAGTASGEGMLRSDLPPGPWRLEGALRLPPSLGGDGRGGRADEMGLSVRNGDGDEVRFRWQLLGDRELLLRGERTDAAGDVMFLQPTLTITEMENGRVEFTLTANGEDVVLETAGGRIAAEGMAPAPELRFHVQDGPAILESARLSLPAE